MAAVVRVFVNRLFVNCSFTFVYFSEVVNKPPCMETVPARMGKISLCPWLALWYHSPLRDGHILDGFREMQRWS